MVYPYRYFAAREHKILLQQRGEEVAVADDVVVGVDGLVAVS